MTAMDPDFMNRARQAREKLVEKYLDHPEVSLIDIGLVSDPAEGEQVVLRIHLRKPSAGEDLQLPSEVDGIPVRVVTGDYRPE